MIEIDGNYGEGGGQILRTSLSLAALSGKTVHFRNIRAGRKEPGLKLQHLACVNAVVEITSGQSIGASVKSQELTVTPGKIRADEYYFAVSSAGSAILIAQTILPILFHADGESKVVIQGGTHAAYAPIYDFFERVYLKCLRQMGAQVESKLEKIGFFPAGGGKITLNIKPVEHWQPYECLGAGALLSARLVSMSHGIPEQIRADELEQALRQIQKAHIPWKQESLEVPSIGPGNVMFAELEFENIHELFSTCGSRCISRWNVANQTAEQVNRYLTLQAPVGEYLADQLLLPMALGAGGKFWTSILSEHTRTNIDVIRKFLDVEIRVEEQEKGTCTIEVKK